MADIKTFSLARHSRLFSVPDPGKDYLFIGSGEHPYHEEPYRAESYALAYIKEGQVRLNAGLSSFDVEAPSIITLGPSVIRYFAKQSDLLKMDVIFFKETYLLEERPDPFFLYKFDFFAQSARIVLPLKDAYYIKIDKIFELIGLTRNTASLYEGELIRNYIFALIYEIDSYYKQNSAIETIGQQDQPLFTKFRRLLAGHYMRERRLKFYAGHLHLTPKSLSAAIKKHTGKTAGKWIEDAVILEAKVLLQNKTLSVSQISGMLNFSDQSVFGKFFRAGARMSPLEYRKQFS
ncbi:MAG TPA: AraC family transcriptional regulator [Pedobacter sp.]|nr:AraC family transcriptional regulator [Pedobacter sp.]